MTVADPPAFHPFGNGGCPPLTRFVTVRCHPSAFIAALLPIPDFSLPNLSASHFSSRKPELTPILSSNSFQCIPLAFGDLEPGSGAFPEVGSRRVVAQTHAVPPQGGGEAKASESRHGRLSVPRENIMRPDPNQFVSPHHLNG